MPIGRDCQAEWYSKRRAGLHQFLPCFRLPVELFVNKVREQALDDFAWWMKYDDSVPFTTVEGLEEAIGQFLHGPNFGQVEVE